MRSAINAAVQDELKAKGEIGERALGLTVLERVSVTREGTRQMRDWQEGNVVAFETALPSQGFARGERGVVVESAGDRATLHMGDGVLKDIVPGRLPKNLSHDAVSVFREKTIALHEGDRIRWTTNDAARGLLNNQQAEVAAIKDDAVTFRAMGGTLHELKPDDRMLERLDLAYALTVHAAQGMTATSGLLVMREEDRRLNSTRSFLVATTRVTDNLTLIVDNAQSVERAVSRNAGDKTSAIAIARDAAPSPALDLPERSLERSR
jgi:hypothetical protein